jgi:hypothetical protein
MQTNSYDTCTKFLIECRKVMGPFDLAKLEHDENYKTEIFSRMSLSADDNLFHMAATVRELLTKESIGIH